MERIKPNFRELFSAFWGTKKQQEESEKESNSDKELYKYMETQGFGEEYKRANDFIRSLEVEQEHQDISIKGQRKGRKTRSQARVKTEGKVAQTREQVVGKEEQDIER